MFTRSKLNIYYKGTVIQLNKAKKVFGLILSSVLAVSNLFSLAGCSKNIDTLDIEDYNTIDVGVSHDMIVYLIPTGYKRSDITWSIDSAYQSNGVATLSSDGCITGLKDGSVNVTASVGGKTDTCTITVRKGASTSTGNGSNVNTNKLLDTLLENGVPQQNIDNFKQYYTLSGSQRTTVEKIGKIGNMYKKVTGSEFGGTVGQIASFVTDADEVIGYINSMSNPSEDPSAQAEAAIKLMIKPLKSNSMTKGLGQCLEGLGLAELKLVNIELAKYQKLDGELLAEESDYTLSDLTDPAIFEEMYNRADNNKETMKFYLLKVMENEGLIAE